AHRRSRGTEPGADRGADGRRGADPLRRADPPLARRCLPAAGRAGREMSKALVVFQKEWLELRLQRGLLLATLGVPPAITVFAIVVFALAGHAPGDVVTRGIPLPPDLIGLSSNEIAQAIVGKQFSVIFFLLPVFIPSVIASYAIVGEKRDRTLEPLLATPIRTSQLLVGKSLSALVPAAVLTLASS